MEERLGVLIFVYSLSQNNLSTLLVKQNNNLWSFPSGGIEENEMPIDAAYRELQEETGINNIELTSTKLINSFYYTPKSKGIQSIFLCKLSNQVTANPDKDFDEEIKETRWVADENIHEFLTRPNMLTLYNTIKNIL